MSRTTRITRSIRFNLLFGIATITLLVAGFGGWAMTAQLAGAIIAPARLVIDGDLKRVQHREGGIVGEIAVAEGSIVRAGDLLIRLDDTTTRATLGIVVGRIHELEARRMRLSAERSNADAIEAPEAFDGEIDEPDFAILVEAENELFQARRETLTGQKRQLAERVLQIGQEVDGLEARRRAKEEELVLVGQELEGVEQLYAKGLVPFPKMAELRRTRTQIAGEEGQLRAETARAAMRIAETELQILQIDQDRLAEVLTELREIDGELGELRERRISALDDLKRIELRAPQAGVIHELNVHTIGGVIAPGETVMSIVPVSDLLKVEARLQPADIDQVAPGQKAVLRFSAFSQHDTPELSATIEFVSADISTDPASGEIWYKARMVIERGEVERLGSLPLVAGMPVEAFIQTGERSALSYLTKPLTDQMARALRED